MSHIPVLLDETIEGLALEPNSRVVDCTFGGGGHTRELLEILGSKGKVLGLDADPDAIVAAPKELINDSRLDLKVANFREVAEVARQAALAQVQGILADLGWRSEQFTIGNRGFSFTADEPLLMTYGKPEEYLFTAADIVNEWAEESIADILFGYGEERAARKIAAAIVAARGEGSIETARQLAELIESTKKPSFKSRIHPATQTFQALRMAVNDELGALKVLLHDGFELLAPGGRLAIISFHSLEDRLVKHTFRSYVHDQLGRLITKKPITPSETEITTNPRARSAKLRIIEKYEHETNRHPVH